jgi:hypothetical protein
VHTGVFGWLISDATIEQGIRLRAKWRVTAGLASGLSAIDQRFLPPSYLFNQVTRSIRLFDQSKEMVYG